MSGFHDIIFPIKMARGAIGGPMRNAQIFTRANGIEARNTILQNSRRKWNIASRGAPLDELHDLLSFYEARMGQIYAFRFRDPFDNKSCKPSQMPSHLDQEIGIGDGNNKVFALQKTYGDAQNSYKRNIRLPVLNSVSISVNGVLKAANTYNVDYQTGLITFQTAPPNGQSVKSGFSFDCMARFNNDALEISLESPSTGRINDIEIIEVLA